MKYHNLIGPLQVVYSTYTPVKRESFAHISTYTPVISMTSSFGVDHSMQNSQRAITQVDSQHACLNFSISITQLVHF